ncbi:hypothetical protein VOLCADRAFT_86409 [Volvox carteri f. nagariensis]|uniref:PWWP domain-containing protein n=1 Tax=Volvox carteri f. nagariensis TaxID=3068 RepID=D8TIP8_VOLCA|nr:uncharacterized protein VOLCADRAFT_86409 [Volvox carteri f. nagariensis]EFJ53281.1 hypothetical protein VOLCADRAFT_86409 [Volvox carteri f. nagariensis]|eukprot:XP_002946286.1 hypothetical protein VOLCADRAFT_86409 [Volvox carteri f. nagariensis]
MEAPYPAQLVGWVVWGKVKSLPWWPGQVMHPSKGPPEVRKMAAMKSNAAKLLVMFLGDNKYAFLPWESVVDFSEHKERHSSTNYASKYWKLGVEEAEELLARRAGLQPSTDHQPVDFATKKTNFSNLAKAWVGGSGSTGRQQCSSGAAGRTTERNKASTAQLEASKIGAPSATTPPDAKAAAHATKSQHRAGGTATDDGRPKSIGGVMLEWARYMPQVAATRKSAELSSSDATIRFARRLARGEELSEVNPDDQLALQRLHSFALQQRLRGVDALVRPATGLTAANPDDGSKPGAVITRQQQQAGDVACFGSSAGAGGDLKDADSASSGPLSPRGPPRHAASGLVATTQPVVVQETFTISDAAAVPVPARVVEMLLKSLTGPAAVTETAAPGGTATCPSPRARRAAAGSGAGGGGGSPSPDEARTTGTDTGAAGVEVKPTGTADGDDGDGDNGGKAADAQDAAAAAERAGSPAAAGGADGGLQPAAVVSLQGGGAAVADSAEEETILEVDVALRVNGKLLPYLSVGEQLLLRTRRSSSSSSSPRPGTQQELGGGSGDGGSTPQRPVALSSIAKRPEQQRHGQQRQSGQSAALMSMGDAAEIPTPAPAAEITVAAAAAAAAAAFVKEVDGMPAAAAAAATREMSPSDGPHPGARPHEGGRQAPTQPLGQQQQEQQQEKQGVAETVPAACAPAGADADNAAPMTEAPSAAAAAAVAANPAAVQGTPGAPARAEDQAALCPSPVPVSPPPTAAAPNSPPAAAAAAAISNAAATIDLSRSLAPWLRGEVRVTCWTVCAPRLLLVAVSADRKRDGGLGGIKREARLLLAEAKERRAASPGGPDDDLAEGAGGEQQLKRRLRSATSPPAPAAVQALGQSPASGSAGGTGRKSSPPPPPLLHTGTAAAAVVHQGKAQQQQHQAEAAKAAGGLPQISATGPAAAALMRSRLLQQKRQASAAEAAAVAATAGAGSGNGGAGTGGTQQPGSDASKSASSAGGGGGTDTRPSKKVKLVRFPGPPVGGNVAAPCSASRVSSGGLPAAAAAAAAAATGAAAAPAGGASAQTDGSGAPAARRRVSYSQLMLNSGGDALDDSQRYGGGRGTGASATGNAGYSCSSYDADWELSYPPWLPQPAQRGAFITVSHLLLNKNRPTQNHHSHHSHQFQTHKADHVPGNYHRNHQHNAPQQVVLQGARGNAATTAAAAAGGQLSHSTFRQPNYNHSYNQHHHHHSHHHHHHHHHHDGQHTIHPIASPRNNGGGGGGRAGSRRSSGHDAWQRDETEELPYPERRMDGWSSDAGTALDIEYGTGAASAAAWLSTSAYGVAQAPTSGTVPPPPPPPPPPPLGGGGSVTDASVSTAPAGFGACEQILLDIRVGDETDAEGPTDPQRRLSGGGAPGDAAIAVTIHLPPRDTAATAVPPPGAPPPPLMVGASYGSVTAGYLPLPHITSYVDLAVAAAILADRHMYVCESAALKPNGAAETEAQQPQSGATAAGEGATVGAAAEGVSGGGAVAAAAARPTLCEGEVVRLRQECDTLREQVKLRLAPGSLDPLPQQQLPYAELVAQVSERILALALQLPSLSGPTKQTFIQYSRTLMQEAAACSQETTVMATMATSAPPQAAAAAATAVFPADDGVTPAVPAAASSASSVSSGRSLAVARVAADLVRSAAAPGLPLHPEDRWAFINLAAELLRP